MANPKPHKFRIMIRPVEFTEMPDGSVSRRVVSGIDDWKNEIIVDVPTADLFPLATGMAQDFGGPCHVSLSRTGTKQNPEFHRHMRAFECWINMPEQAA